MNSSQRKDSSLVLHHLLESSEWIICGVWKTLLYQGYLVNKEVVHNVCKSGWRSNYLT